MSLTFPTVGRAEPALCGLWPHDFDEPILLSGPVHSRRSYDFQTKRPGKKHGSPIIQEHDVSLGFLGENNCLGFADVHTRRLHHRSDAVAILNGLDGQLPICPCCSLSAGAAPSQGDDFVVDCLRDGDLTEEARE